jgi:putative hydrolase of the HAD superfamily
MIRAVAFDLDNTLINFMGFKRKSALAAARAMARSGLAGSPGKIAREIFGVYDEYGIEYQKTFSTYLWKRGIRDFNEFEKIQQAAIVAYLDCKFHVLKPYRGVVPVLKRLHRKGMRICLVSDASRKNAWRRLAVSGMQNLFDLVVTHDDTGEYKPHPSPFKILLRKTRLKPEQIIFVGDNPHRDILGAKKMGMRTALADYGCEWPKKGAAKADFVLRRFGELEDVLREM